MLLGDTQVGKTSILKRLRGDPIPTSHMPTIGIDVKICSFQHNEETIKLQVWDTAGQEKLRTIPKMYYAHSEGFVLVYDITDADTFRNIGYWVDQICSYKDNAMRLLIGNKADLDDQREVSTLKGQELADKIQVDFIETSAITGTNIEHAFAMIAKKLIVVPLPRQEESVRLSESSIKLESKGCCS